MSITIYRCFHPVGQGAFYSERFRLPNKKTLNVVYDCGSDLEISQWQGVIDNEFRKNEEIEFLYLSHFHEDHVSGVQHLLKRCRVKNVFLPQLTDSMVFLSLAENLIESEYNPFVERLLVDPVNTIQSHGHKRDGYPAPRVIFVQPSAPEEQIWWEAPLPLNQETIQMVNGKNTWESGKPLRLSDMVTEETNRWCFVPFNLEFQTRSIKFQENLNARGITLGSPTAFSSAWGVEKSRKKIIDAFESVASNRKKNQNENTLTLYSGPFHNGALNGQSLFTSKHAPTYLYPAFGPIHPKLRQECLDEWRKLVKEAKLVCRSAHCEKVLYFLERSHNFHPMVGAGFTCEQLGSLYMGDYCAKELKNWEALKKCYQKWKEHIGILQVPHHGSSHNYNEEIGKWAKFHVISCGKKNKYAHPGPSVVDKIIRWGGSPFLVTESHESEVIQLIRIG